MITAKSTGEALPEMSIVVATLTGALTQTPEREDPAYTNIVPSKRGYSRNFLAFILP